MIQLSNQNYTYAPNITSFSVFWHLKPLNPANLISFHPFELNVGWYHLLRE